MPLIDSSASIIFAENTVNAAPQLLDSNVAFTSTASLSGGRLVVSGLLVEDRVSILGNGADPVVFASGTVSQGGVAFGTTSGGVGASFSVTFNANATASRVERLIESLAYRNVSDTPTATRNLTLDVVDGAGQGLGLGIGTLSALTGTANPFNGLDVGSISAPSFVDLDGDGDLDLVSGETTGTFLAWRNTGTTAAPVFTPLTGTANPFDGLDAGFNSTPAFMGLDGDGDPDLIAGQFSNTILAWRNTGSAIAPAFTALTGSANPFDSIGGGVARGFKPALVDLDGDGDLDLVSGVYDGTIQAWRNTGTTAAPVFTQLTGSANPFSGIDVGISSAPAFVDLDGDGGLDLVSGAYDGTIQAWRNTGTAAAPVFTALTGSANPFSGIDVGAYSTPAFMDLDGDGDLDPVSGAGNGALLAWRNITALPTITITVSAENDAPSVTSAATASFAENGIGLAYQATGADLDGTPLGWTLGGTDAGLFNINAASGAVSFKTAPDFEAPADIGGNNVYDITVTASDGASSTAPRNVAITVTNVVGGPRLTDFGPSITVAESTVNAALQLLDSDVIFTGETALSGGRLVVAGLLAEDRVSILNQGDGAGQIGFAGGTVSYGGEAFGTASGGVGAAFTVTLNANATAERVDALIQRLAYQNVSDTPTAVRHLTLNVLDGTSQGLGDGIGPLSALTGGANPFNGLDVGYNSTPAFVDLDGDGDLDLVSGERGGNILAWRNTGTAAAPVFTPITGTANPFNGIDVRHASTPAFVDLDGDGDLDLVSGAYRPVSSASLGILLAWRNTGSAVAPVFTALTGDANPFNAFNAFYGQEPIKVAFVDLDGDGDLDFVSGSLSGQFQTWRNTGTVAAPIFTKLIGGQNPLSGINVGFNSAPAFVDIDGDGDLDLISGNSDGNFQTWRNTGTVAAPAFTTLTGTANPFNGFDVGSISAPTFVDLDGDGDLDLVSGERGGTIFAWRNTTALPIIAVTVTAENDAPRLTSGGTASLAENGTGVAYQATGSDAESSTLSWVLGGTDAGLFNINAASGAVTFKAAPDFEAPADSGGNNVYDITVTASDGALSSASRAVAIAVTNVVERSRLAGLLPTTTLAENAVNAAPHLLDSDVDFILGDMLSGGRLLVTGLLAEDRVSILNQGDGAGQIGFAGGTVSYDGEAFGTASGGVGAAFTVTFNANATAAKVDALIQRLAYQNVSDTPTAMRHLTLNVLDGTSQGLADGVGPLSALSGDANPFNGFDVGRMSPSAFVDLDGDGDLDLVSGEVYGTFLAWRNTGTAAAPLFMPLTGTDNPFNGINVRGQSAPAFVDLDGDGDLDLVSGAYAGILAAWWNTGTAAAPLFTDFADIFNGIDVGFSSKPAFVDLDGDGNLDLVSGQRYAAILAWRNTGTVAAPVFTPLTGTANPFSGINAGFNGAPAFVDIDGDGDLDLISGNSDGNIKTWRNTGSLAAPIFTALTGTASPFNGINVGSNSTPAFVDMDGDGDLDLVSGTLDGTVLAWRNTSTLPRIAVTVTAENDAPSVTSAGTASFAENGTGVAYQAAGADAEGATLSWTLGGMDALLFNINAAGGAVTFKNAPNFEAPADSGGNNVYDITITASDGALSSAAQSVAILVTDVLEPVNRVGGAGADLLIGGATHDRLGGGAGNDTLIGGDGNDMLDGGLGADSMEGGTGNDTYYLNDAGDVMLELAGGGYDRVVTAFSYTLAAEFERLSFSGTADLNGTGNGLANRLDGNAGANVFDGGEGNDGLYGYAGNDTLIAGGGQDTLDGGLGADSLEGGAGNDTYYMDDAGDVLLELTGGGYDRVVTAFSHTLAAEFERLSLTGTADLNGTGNALANRLDGNAGANIVDGGEANDGLYGYAANDTLIGGGGNDTLDGGLGGDSLEGGAGNDSYYLDDAGDVMLELAGGGYDRAVTAFSHTLGVELERLSLSGTADLNGTGNALANRLDGNGGANILDGGEANDGLYGYGGNDTLIGGVGQDTLDGGLGADSLDGGLGKDIFLFNTPGEANGDIITDFNAAQGDRIDLRPMDADAASPGNQGFIWAGASFALVAGQLRFANSMLEGDVDGDGAADFQIGLSGMAVLSGADIWL